MYVYIVKWLPKILFLITHPLLEKKKRYVTHPKKPVGYVNSLNYLGCWGWNQRHPSHLPGSWTVCPPQADLLHVPIVDLVPTSPSAMPFWIILFAAVACPPTLWEWARNRDMGQTVLLEEKDTAGHCFRSASQHWNNQQTQAVTHLWQETMAEVFMGRTGEERFTFCIDHSCIWRRKVTVNSWDIVSASSFAEELLICITESLPSLYSIHHKETKCTWCWAR